MDEGLVGRDVGLRCFRSTLYGTESHQLSIAMNGGNREWSYGRLNPTLWSPLGAIAASPRDGSSPLIMQVATGGNLKSISALLGSKLCVIWAQDRHAHSDDDER